MSRIPAPRLLPATIVALGALLVVKCGVLMQVAMTHGQKPDSVMVAGAYAASTDQVKESTKPEPAKPEPVKAGPAASSGAVSPSAQIPAPDTPPPVSDSERALLQDLRQRRQELDTRAVSLAARESVLVATEQKLSARVVELQGLQRKLEGLDAAQKQKEEAGWQGLVKLYESMKPKDAATIFNDLPMSVLLQLMDRMKDAKAAMVMAAMTPDKARDVTADLARMRTGRDASGAPLAALKNNQSGG
jgi:flagellar motility protein MotE (MotC chaperone)